MFRQPVRTILLILLIAAASFIFVSNTAELIIINDAVESIGGYYREIAYLTLDGSNGISGNIYPGAQIVKSSQYVESEDRRRGIDSVLSGMANIDIAGMHALPNWKPDYWHYSDAFFYAALIGVEHGAMHWPSSIVFQTPGLPETQPYVQLNLRVDEVVTGYPEHIIEEQDLILKYFLSESEIEEYEALNIDSSAAEAALYPAIPIDDMIVGQRYFLRGAYYNQSFYDLPGSGLPEIGRISDPLDMRPLNERTLTEVNERYIEDDEIWYIPVDAGQSIDFSFLGMENLDEEIIRMSHAQSSMQLRTMIDMAGIPYMQPEANLVKLSDGRLIDTADAQSMNHVAVVSKYFAESRNLHLGDMITIFLPKEQVLSGIYDTGNGRVPNDLVLRAFPFERYDNTLELEIVGLYSLSSDAMLSNPLPGPGITYPYNVVYIPDSILPNDYVLTASTSFSNDYMQTQADISEYLPESWYSFVLADPRDESAFLNEVSGSLSSLGITAHFLPNNALVFWDSADPIVQGAKFNAITFSLVFLLVAALAMFLHYRQRRKDYAIALSLGKPRTKTRAQYIVSSIVLGLPSVVLGSAAVWFYVRNYGESTLMPLFEIENSSVAISLPFFCLPILVSCAFVLTLAMSALFMVLLTKRPLLDNLVNNKQG